MKKIILLLLLLLPSSPVFSADSTSYAPPGVAQNQHQDQHGYSITGVGELEAASITLGGVTKDTWPGGVEGSLGATGWTKLENGLIIQWGRVTGLPMYWHRISFPRAFSSVFSVTNSSQTTGNANAAIRNITPTGFDVYNSGTDLGGGINWMALGY